MTDGGEGIVGPKGSDFSVRVYIAQKKRFENPLERARLAKWQALAHESLKKKHEAKRVDGLAPWQQRKRATCTRIGSDEHRKKVSAATRAAMAAPEIAEKVARCARERAANPEWRRRISNSKSGKKIGKRTPEQVARQVEAIKAAWADPIKRATRIEKNRLARAQRKQ